MSNFIEIDPTTLQNNPFQMLGRDWALVTVSDPDTGKVNTMTVSWGAMGVLWARTPSPSTSAPSATPTSSSKDRSFHPQLLRRDAGRPHPLRPHLRPGRRQDRGGRAAPRGEEEYPWFAESKLVFCCNILYRSAFDPRRWRTASTKRTTRPRITTTSMWPRS